MFVMGKPNDKIKEYSQTHRQICSGSKINCLNRQAFAQTDVGTLDSGDVNRRWRDR